MSEVTLNNLKLSRGSKRRAKRVGRGNASGRGTYSSRGLKGQKSRSGGRGGLKLRGLKQLLRNKPKMGGFKSPHVKLNAVTIVALEKIFNDGELVNAAILAKKKIIHSPKTGLKIIGNGKLSKKLNVTADKFSESAKKAIMEAGGTITEVVARKKTATKSKKK